MFLELGPRVHWSHDKLWAGALRSMGDRSGKSGRSKNHTQREGREEKQTEALEKLNSSTKQRDHDHMFASIKTYDGKDPKEFDEWIEQIMTACKKSGRNPKLVALAKINRGSNRSNYEHEARSNLGRIHRRTKKVLL